jgi:uncharacterized protein
MCQDHLQVLSLFSGQVAASCTSCYNRYGATRENIMALDLKQPIVDEPLLVDITRRIVEQFNPDKIILFGSHAYGQPGPDSDVDLFVIMDSQQSPARRSALVSLACRPPLLAMDILVRTPQEVEQRLAAGDSFVRDILLRGRVMYERSSLG